MADEKRRFEMMQFAEETIRQNPAITREEMESMIKARFYNEDNVAAKLPEAKAAEAVKRRGFSLRRRAPQILTWLAAGCGVFLVALIVLYLADPPGIPWPQSVRNVAKAVGEEEEIRVVSQEDQEQYMLQAATAIEREGREVFLGRQLADLINDAELAAVSVRLLQLSGSDTVEKDRARVAAYIREHKLVYYCLVRNDQSQWQSGPEKERYRRLRDAVLATDKHVDVLYKSMQVNDFTSMLHAIGKIRQSYVLVGAFPF